MRAARPCEASTRMYFIDIISIIKSTKYVQDILPQFAGYDLDAKYF